MDKRVSRDPISTLFPFYQDYHCTTAITYYYSILLLISIAVTASDCALFHGLITGFLLDLSPLDPGRL